MCVLVENFDGCIHIIRGIRVERAVLFLKDDGRRREDFVGDAKDDDDLVDPTRGLVSTNETRDGELQHRREHGTSSFFSNDTTTNNGFGIHWCFPRWTRDVKKERRGPRRSLPGSGVVSTISTDLLRCIFGPL